MLLQPCAIAVLLSQLQGVQGWVRGLALPRFLPHIGKQVFKTLVLRGDKTGHFVCVIPGDEEVNLKKAAKVSGNKKADLIPMKELLPTTGYIRGGCSPVGMKKPFPTYFDSSCEQFEYIYVSAGVRGLQLKVRPALLVDYVKAALAELTDKDNQ